MTLNTVGYVNETAAVLRDKNLQFLFYEARVTWKAAWSVFNHKDRTRCVHMFWEPPILQVHAVVLPRRAKPSSPSNPICCSSASQVDARSLVPDRHS